MKVMTRWGWLVGMAVVLGVLGLVPATAQESGYTYAGQSNLPRHVTIKNSRGQTWAELNYSTNGYEYYSIWIPGSRTGGSIHSPNSKFYELTGPEHWTIHGTGHGFALVDGSGTVVANVSRWGKTVNEAQGVGTAGGITGDWKVTNARGKVWYYLQAIDHGYNILDPNYHILNAVDYNDKGAITVKDKGNKVWWTVSGASSSLSASCMALKGISPWGRLLMASYFFADWW